MTSLKAKLRVILMADEVVVAEAEDASLWQRVLSVINGGKSEIISDALKSGSQESEKDPPDPAGIHSGGPSKRAEAIDQLSQQLGIETASVQGACSPIAEAPFLHLDPHCWEEMKKQLPQRGSLAVPPIVAAATLLALWFRAASLGNLTQAQAKQVLGTINLADPNASRSLKNTSWLQGRPGAQIVLNPAEISKAVKLAKCFCTKDWAAWKESAG
jgi:hypothetical protein